MSLQKTVHVKSCGRVLSTPQKLNQHYVSDKIPCHKPAPDPVPELIPQELSTSESEGIKSQPSNSSQHYKVETDVMVFKKELRFKKNRKFQTKCIQIVEEILNEEPIIKYYPSFLNGLEFDAFFKKYQITLEVQ
ncbi:11787_t:CDS:2, partial [Diversispora eburnea]